MISYGGIQLLDDGEALERVEAVLSPADLYDFARRTWPGRLVTLGMSWLERETKPCLNRLVWPTGASRWSMGWFLTDDAGLSLIRPQAYANNTLNALPFVMSDGLSSIAANLYMLPPRPLGQNGTGGDLYLLPLVDRRYFFWETAGTISVTAGVTSWASLFGQYATALGVVINVDNVPAAYLTPPVDFATTAELLPPQIDAAARSVGMRFVANLDGTYSVLSAASGGSAQPRFLADAAFNPLAAGGVMALGLPPRTPSDLAGMLPQSVTVAFPTVDASNIPTGGTTTQAVTLASLVSSGTLAAYSGAASYAATRLVRCSAAAGPSNTAQIAALANQIAADFYLWAVAPMDAAYAGVCPWLPSGYEDRIEWSHRGQEITTRVQRPPWNARDEAATLVGPGVVPPPSGPQTEEALTTSAIPAMTGTNPGSGTATLQKLSGGALVTTGAADVTVYNDTPLVWPSNVYVRLVLEPISQQWFIAPDHLSVANLDASVVVNPCFTIKTNNDQGTKAFGRLHTAGSPGGIAQLDWQGFLLYQSGGSGGTFVGPWPDLKVVEGAGISIAIANDAGDSANQLTLSATSILTVENLDATQVVSNCVTIKTDNTDVATGLPSTAAFGRIYCTASGTTAQLDWQGFHLYHAGYVGPEPDLELQSPTNSITIVCTDDSADKRVVATLDSNLTIENTDATQVLTPPIVIKAHNDLGTSKLARMHAQSSGGTISTLDWQGLYGYVVGGSNIGPVQDIGFNAGTNVTLSIAAGTSPIGGVSAVLTINATASSSVTAGEVVIPMDYTVTTTNASTGLAVTLAAGTYLFWVQAHLVINVNILDQYIQINLYNFTAGAAVPNAISAWYNTSALAVDEGVAYMQAGPYVISTPGTVIQLRAQIPLGPTFTQSTVAQSGAGSAPTKLVWLKIA